MYSQILIVSLRDKGKLNFLFEVQATLRMAAAARILVFGEAFSFSATSTKTLIASGVFCRATLCT
jgi:hypothetical protein